MGQLKVEEILPTEHKVRGGRPKKSDTNLDWIDQRYVKRVD
jgi:hypothetical protein